MDTQLLHRTIEEQNQVIIAKDATIDKLQEELRDVKSEITRLRFDRSWQKLHKQWVTKALEQKSVKIIGGFEYHTRYIPMHVVVITVIITIITTFLVTRQAFL